METQSSTADSKDRVSSLINLIYDPESKLLDIYPNELKCNVYMKTYEYL